MTKLGNVFWLTGLSGAGKSTIGRLLYQYIRESIHLSVVFLDGDELRALFDLEKKSYTIDERKQVAFRNGRLCKFLSDQGIDVVCATISLFKECQDWNRENIPNYHEILLQSPLSILEKRDPKKIYARARAGCLKNVAGVDLPIDFPVKPDLLLENDGKTTPEELLQKILDTFIFSTHKLQS